MKLDIKNATIKAYLLIGMVFLNLIAILDLPYSFYGFLRVLNFIAASFMAFGFNKKQMKVHFFISLFILILYNPFMKIRSNKEIWTGFNLIVVGCSAYYLYKNRYKLDEI